VKLGIAAPAQMPIHREEVAERIDGGPPALGFATCA
jgi:sRNA-binding carbon storage regulator CsrA